MNESNQNNIQINFIANIHIIDNYLYTKKSVQQTELE